MESAQLPRNHFCQKCFGSDPGDGQQHFSLLQGAFLCLKVGHPVEGNMAPSLKAASTVPVPLGLATPHKGGLGNQTLAHIR